MRKLMVSILSVFVLTISFGLANEAGATLLYDLAADWSASSNPNGAWTYGYYTGSSLNQANFSAFGTSGTGGIVGPDDLTSLEFWSNGGDPNLIKNTGSTFTTTNFDQITFRANAVTFGPYLGPTVARWTAQSPGDYMIGATFSTVQVGNTAPNAYVYDGSMNNLGVVPAYSATVGYNAATLTLAQDQFIDFVVWGGDGANKTTEVSAWIEMVSEAPTPIPEPATMLLLGTGLVGIAGAARRKKKNQA